MACLRGREKGFIGKEGTEPIEERALALVGLELTPQGLAQLLLDVTTQGVWQGPPQQLLQEVQGRRDVLLLEQNLSQLEPRHICQGVKRIVRRQASQGLQGMTIGSITRFIAGGEQIRQGSPESRHADLTDDSAFAAWITLHYNDVGFQRGAIVFLGPENICYTRRNEVIARVLRIALQKRRVGLLGGLELTCCPLCLSPLQQLDGRKG